MKNRDHIRIVVAVTLAVVCLGLIQIATACPDPPPDTDHDGLPDPWETQYFGDLTHGPNEDTDGDGYTNLEEYLNGTDPTVIDKPLKIYIAEPKRNSNIP